MINDHTKGMMPDLAILEVLNERKWLRGAYVHAWAAEIGADPDVCPVSTLRARLKDRGTRALEVLRQYHGQETFITLDPDASCSFDRWDNKFMPINHECDGAFTGNSLDLHKHNGTTLYYGTVIPICTGLLAKALRLAETGFAQSGGGIKAQGDFARALAQHLDNKYGPVPPPAPVMPPIQSLAEQLGAVARAVPHTQPSAMAAPHSVGVQAPVKSFDHITSKDTTMNNAVFAAPSAASVRRVVLVRIMDNDPSLLVEHSHVFDSGAITTESDDMTTIMQALADYDINAEVARHNQVRGELTDETILRNTGQDVKLRPIKLKDLTITVVKV